MRPVWRLAALGAVIGGGVYISRGADDLYHTGAFRMGCAAVTVGKIAYDYKSTLRGMDPASKEFIDMKSEVHSRSARRLRDLACQNGGCFIKVGQHLGSLDYLLPQEYVNTLKVLHSDAPTSDVRELFSVIEEDLKKEVDEMFDDFEPEPIGAASLAQVHKAKLKDGTPVAVKIQYPRVLAHSFVDIATMEILVKVVGWIFPEFQFKWLTEETKKNLPLELDFINEGENCERVARMLQNFSFLKVPKIHWDFCSKRILTMEYCEGGKVNDKQYLDKHGISVKEVLDKLGQLYSEMIFVQGYVHCDPHPGNVLVYKSPGCPTQLVLLDHGLYQSLTDEFRINYANLWMSIIEANVDKIKLYSGKMNCGHLYGLFACMLTARSWDSISHGVGQRKFTKEEDVEISSDVSQFLPEIAQILQLVPRQMLLLLKTNDLIRGIESSLQSRSSPCSFLTMSKSCTKALANNHRHECSNWLDWSRITIREKWTLFKISLYSFYIEIVTYWVLN